MVEGTSDKLAKLNCFSSGGVTFNTLSASEVVPWVVSRGSLLDWLLQLWNVSVVIRGKGGSCEIIIFFFYVLPIRWNVA